MNLENVFSLVEHAPLVVDYSKSIEQLILEGNYDDEVNQDITTENFPIIGKGVVTLNPRTLHLTRDTPDEEVNAWCVAYRHRRGTTHETLTFAIPNPRHQNEGPLLAGQVWIGRGTRVLSLGQYKPFQGKLRRSVRLAWVKKPWSTSYSFLVFPLDGDAPA